MDGESGVREKPRVSPWPVFVALGLVLSEVGVVLGVGAIAVGGVVLFGTSVVGILRESRYAATLRWPALGVGTLFAALGTLLYVLTGADARGVAVALGGALLLAGGVAVALVETGRL
jgi:hypothetical protein